MITRAIVAGGALLASTGAAFAALEGSSRYNFQVPATRIAHEINELHMIMLGSAWSFSSLVFGVMFYSIWKHRKSRGAQGRANFHENTTVEIIWTVVPFVILVGMAWPATRVVLDIKDTSSRRSHHQGHRLPVEVGLRLPEGRGRGHQLLLQLATPREQIEEARPRASTTCSRSTTLVVPVGKKVRLLITAERRDPLLVGARLRRQAGRDSRIHPRPGFRAEKTGIYRGQCVELCGKDHGFMPIVVEVVSAAEVRRLGRRSEEEDRRGRRRSDQGRGARTNWPRAARRSTPRTASPATRPPGRACRARSRRSSGSPRSTGPKDGQIAILLNGVVKDGKPTAMALVQAAVGHRHRGGHHLHPEQLGATRPVTSCSRPRSRPPQVAVSVARRPRTSVLRSSSMSTATTHTITPTTTTTITRIIPTGIMRWLTTTNHKDIGTLYLWFSFTMFIIGGMLALGIRAELFQPGLQFWSPEFFNQLTTMHGAHHGVRRDHAGVRGLRELAGADDDRCARHGVRAHEQLELLAAAAGGHAAGHLVLRAGRRDRRRLDALCAAVDADGPGHGPRDLRAAHHGRDVDHGLDQHRRDDPQHARARHDADEDAAVRLDLAHHRVSADRGDAGARRRDHDDC